MEDENIVELVGNYVLDLLPGKLPNDLSFHNVRHTQDVVKAAIGIASECRFSSKQLEVVTLAAWFHDCGYTTTYINHEDSSKAIAADFLDRNNYPEKDIEKILACIEATRFPQNPKSSEEEVVADADFYHFTKPDYPRYEQQIRKEFAIYLGKTYLDADWTFINYTLLKNHTYYTEYGKRVLQRFKDVNIERLETILTEMKWVR